MHSIPGKIYLCQVSHSVSCGACCGLYNVTPISHESLLYRLEIRTRHFQRTPRTADAILNFGRWVETTEDQHRPYPEFHHCPYIGLVGPDHTRVGCLLHPQEPVNEGLDFRGLSYYGGMACREYFCPAHRELCAAYKEILRRSADNWFAYGLLITESALVNALFRETERRLGFGLQAEHFQRRTSGVQLVNAMAAFKLHWPFRSAERPSACHYFFNDGLYAMPPSRLGPTVRPGPYEEILRSLDTDPRSQQQRKSAEDMVDDFIARIASLATGQPGRPAAG
jgi:hypothetical protein